MLVAQRHACQLYRDRSELLDGLVAYFASGLANAERCVWITSGELRPEQARAALALAVPDVGDREARGQLMIVDADADPVEAWIARGRAAVADGYRGLRVGGGPALGDRSALAGQPIVALRSYRIDQLAPDDILDILHRHDGVLVHRDGAWQPVTSAAAALALLDGGGSAHRHSVEFFDRGAFPARAIGERLAQALARGEGALVLATGAHVAAVRGELACRVDALAPLLEQGRLVMLDADQVYAALAGKLVTARLDALLGTVVREMAARCGRVHAYGELVDVACRHGDHTGALALEQWWNAQLPRYPLELGCGYEVQSFDHPSALPVFRAICDEHGTVDAAGERTAADAGRLAAELQQVTSLLDAEAEHLARLQRITAALADALTVEEIGEVAEGEIALALGATRVALEVRGRLVALRGVTAPDDPGAAAASLQALPAQVVAAGFFEGDVTTVAPIMLRELRSGTLVLGSARAPSESQRALLAGVVRQLAAAIERARAIEDVHQLRIRAEDANAAKDRFLAMLGHELRNPLSPILMATQLMRARAPDVLAQERATIERGASQLIRLVDDLLEVSRITRSKLDLTRTPVELGQIVTQAIERASSAIEGRTQSVRVTVAPGLVIDVDAARLAQALANVIANAAKYMRPGGLIEIDADRRGDMVVVEVVDHGVGIPASLLPHVFDLFVQGDQSADRMQGGLGVGLAIARSIIELHGGTITAASAGADQGSSFTIALPRWVAPASDGARAATSPRQRVLVVDDNRDAAWLLAEALVLLGHEVRVSHDGESALEAARAWAPQLAFCDLGLPGMDGFALARALQELPARPRLIALTGYDQSSARAQSRAAGFDLHLIKPIGLREIQLAVEASPPAGR
jgi:signal transduction histidine kinase